MVMLTKHEYDILLVTLAWVGGFVPVLLGKRWTWLQAVGLALVLTPFLRMAINITLTFPTLFEPTVLEPVAREALWRGIRSRLLYYLLIPGLGLMLMHNALPGLASRRAATTPLPRILDAHGLAPRHSWKRDALRGLALFFFIALAYALVFGLAQQLGGILSPGDDETRYWQNITIPLIVLVSASAALTEEFLFRGLLLRRLVAWWTDGFARVKRLPAWLRRLDGLPWLLAALTQAVFFGFIHAGYGSWTHVLGPLAFGLGMAWIVRVLGLLPAMLLHMQVNVVFFAFDVGPDYVATQGFVGLAGLLALLTGLTAASVAALVATRADAVRLLWRSLLNFFGEPRPEVPTAGDEPRTG